MDMKERVNNILGCQTITKTLIFMLISLVMFYPFNPMFIIYIFIMAVIWGILLINYKIKKNSQFFFNMVLFSIINLGILALMKHFIHYTLHMNWVNMIVFIIYVFVLLVILIRSIQAIKKPVLYPVDNKVLFSRRKHDLNRALEYIKQVDILGINGIWGSGKSFFVEHLKKHLLDCGKYIFIDVDLLSCNLDELQTILLNEMELALYEHKIIPRYSTKLKRMLHENTIYRSLLMFLTQDDMSYSKALSGFMEEVSLLEETIVIVYEDIDRISNLDIVKKIFSISEKMAGKHIKIIYQYEENNLKGLGLDREYLEKYIPFIVNLTPINFIELLETVLEDEKIDEEILKVEDFSYLNQTIFSDHRLEEILGINYAASIQMGNVSIRRAENFIKELVINLNEKEEYGNKEYKKLVINFYFVKHFFTELYNKLSLEEGLLDTIKFNYKGSEYSILELIAMGKAYKENKDKTDLNILDFKILFEIPENKNNLYFLSLFEYNLGIDDINENYYEIINEPTQNIRRKASNDKKDRLIWNLLCNGKSEYTDYEIAAKKLIVDVLSKPVVEQRDAYNVFMDEMFHGKHEKRDNTTIFRIGIPNFITLAQALRVSDVDETIWEQFIDLYLNYREKDIIDLELVQILNYCSLKSRKVYLFILNKFNELMIVGNMNKEKGYKKFIKKYIRALSSLGYANTPDVWRLDIPEGIALKAGDIEDSIRFIKKDILEMKNKVNLEMIQKELNTILLFMDKNIFLAKNETALINGEPRFHSEMRTRHINQEEFDRLSKIRERVSNEEFMKVLETSYNKESITAYEVNNLLN